MGSYLLLFKQFGKVISNVETRILSAIGLNGYNNNSINDSLDWNYCPSATESTPSQNESNSQSILESIIDNGFLWAVPNHRRTIEKRLCRKNAKEKHLKFKKNLTMCNVCGHYHVAHTFCGNCYSKVREETQAIQKSMVDTWQFDPVDKDVVVLYANDDKNPKEFWKGKRIVEVDRERPLWFHKNLQTKCNTDSVTDRSSEANTIISKVK
ncbi:hypothetical protein CHUAL_011016 [Chamberlinius hualienensis]